MTTRKDRIQNTILAHLDTHEDWTDWQAVYDDLEKPLMDMENWLRSELQQETQPKMGKHHHNEEKIQLLEKILGKLENLY